MRDLHALAGPLLPLALLVLGAWAAALAASRRPPGALDTVRKVVLALVAVQAAIGLAIALRGAAPAEWIHWVYGPAIVAALLVPGGLVLPPERRSAVLAAASIFAALLAWRLWASG
jgi:hypothetical protein